MTEETRESSFDALAKGMASGTVSRGRALRLMGAAPSVPPFLTEGVRKWC
jgi:hypothetical protein